MVSRVHVLVKNLRRVKAYKSASIASEAERTDSGRRGVDRDVGDTPEGSPRLTLTGRTLRADGSLFDSLDKALHLGIGHVHLLYWRDRSSSSTES